MTASLTFAALTSALTSALAKWALRNAGTRFAVIRASSAGADLYRTDIPFLLKAGSRTGGFQRS
jgi:L-rhamnose isomerase